MNFILASRSPERSKILSDMGLRFETVSANIDESPLKGEKVDDMVLRLAQSKARHIAQEHEGVIIAADTLIEQKGQPLGQPKNLDMAKAMLDSYVEDQPFVWTATVWLKDGELQSDVSKALLAYQPLNEAEWEAFFEKAWWRRRAGAFSIFHQPCPLKIVEGDFDVVRGIHSAWIGERLKELEVELA